MTKGFEGCVCNFQNKYETKYNLDNITSKTQLT